VGGVVAGGGGRATGSRLPCGDQAAGAREHDHLPARDRGVFVQGVFRSNMAIMGLAFVQNAYGNAGLPSGAVYVGVVTLLYNVLSVITLSRSGARAGRRRWLHVGRNIVTNPLIVAIVSALLLQRLNIDLPRPVMQTARYMANIALPMALICAGATFDVRSVLDTSGISLQASIGRLVVAPLTAVAVGLAFGLRGIPMGVLFLMCAMPVAAASYVMAKAMGGNDVAAANIDVDMIVQNQAVNGTTDFSFTVNQNDFKRTMKVLETEVVPGLGGGEVNGDPLIAKVSIVGLGMKSHAGIAARMFECLAKEGINIRMISTSEIKTSVVIEDKYLELAVRALHAAFGLEGEAVEEKVV